MSFLPGMTLTIAAAELTNRQIIAGSSRLVYGGAQLMLLVFGVVMGLAVVGNLVDPTFEADQLGWWAPWLAVFVITVGFVLFQSAPSGSFVWILLMLLITTVAQRVGSNWLTPALSGFVGALVIVPVSRALARIPAAPPATMLAFPAFLLLVPGALGFIGLNQAVTGAAQSVETLVQTGSVVLRDRDRHGVRRRHHPRHRCGPHHLARNRLTRDQSGSGPGFRDVFRRDCPSMRAR